MYSLDDVLESWVGTADLNSRRFVQDFVENDKPNQRQYEIYPDSGFFREKGSAETQPLAADPLDDAAFFYFVRVTPLEVGQEVHLRPVLPEGQEPGDHRGDSSGRRWSCPTAARCTAWCCIR